MSDATLLLFLGKRKAIAAEAAEGGALKAVYREKRDRGRWRIAMPQPGGHPGEERKKDSM
jgi:hypothetical protein